MERRKTLIFVCVALAATIVAAMTRPKKSDFVEVTSAALVGKPLVDFTDADKARSLEIVRADAEAGALKQFKVARSTTGSWTIPSHFNYPADSPEQVVQACTLFVGTKILDVVPKSETRHEYYGVVEPTVDNASEDGVGTLVRIEGEQGDELMAIVIGKADKRDPQVRYVRKLGQDVVFVAKVDPTALSTTFSDWIDTDVLKLPLFDLKNIEIRDYALVEQQPNIWGPVNRTLTSLNWDPVRTSWDVNQLLVFDPQRGPTEASLQPDEELQLDVLNQLTRALRDLNIIDIRPKPTGMANSVDLSSDDRKRLDASLASMGFRTDTSSGASRLLAEKGEVLLTLKSGVRFVLKFGRTAAKSISELQEQNRVLLVTVELDESAAPLPLAPELPTAQPGDDVDAVEAERERLKREYQRELDKRNEGLADARRQVNELNERFAGWYYVVSNELYEQILLNRSDIVKKRDTPAENATGPSNAGSDDAATSNADTDADTDNADTDASDIDNSEADAPGTQSSEEDA